MSEQQDKKQIIIEGLLTTLSYRAQKIDELEAELIALTIVTTAFIL
jgi:hypothetical protein|nr:MAG TPA: hypothetical protein [Caudoviricetes sp.]